MAKRTKAEIKNLSARLPLKSTPLDWLEKARALRHASNHLLIHFEEEQLAYEEKFERTLAFELEPPDASVLMMLLGFAIENLLKGLYVSTLKIAKPPRTLRELGVSGHCLAVIANKLEVALGETFSQRELDILAAVEQTILWYGRYPSPVDADKLISTSDHTLFSMPMFRYPKDHFDACAMCDRLESLLIPRAPFSIQKKMLDNQVRVGRMPGDADDLE